jgi:hypothetical protein
MSSTPDYGDKFTRVGDYIRYPKRVLLQALTEGFKQEYLFTDGNSGERFPNPYLYKETPDGETAPESEIELADAWTDELNKTDPRPMVIVRRDQFVWTESSINSLRDPDVPRGRIQKFNDLVNMPLVFNCFAREDVESEELALVVGMFLRLFRDIHMQRTRLQKMSVPIIGSTTPVLSDSEIELFVTPVSLTTYMTIAWQVQYQELREVKSFQVNISTEGD